MASGTTWIDSRAGLLAFAERHAPAVRASHAWRYFLFLHLPFLQVDVQAEEIRMKGLEQQGILRMGTGKFPEGVWDIPRAKPKDGCSILEALLEERIEGRCVWDS